jgi:hypothetical protein
MRYHDAVERTTLSIPGPLLERLRVAAAELDMVRDDHPQAVAAP